MGELEDYLLEHARPDRSAVIGQHIRNLEDFYYFRLDSLGFKHPVYQNVLVKDEQRNVISLLSYASINGGIDAMRIFEGNRHVGDRKLATLEACRYLAERFWKTVRLMAVAYNVAGRGYTLKERIWIVNKDDWFEPDLTCNIVQLLWEDKKLVVGRTFKIREKNKNGAPGKERRQV